MVFNILNGIPVVGHVKGMLHYVSGNHWEGDKAIRAATRSSVVIASGVVGAVGGPAGMIAGATGAGLLCDTVTSVAIGRPQGIIEGVSDIVDGKHRATSVIKTGMLVAGDAFTGLGGGALVSNVGSAVVKSTAKNVAKTAVKKGLAFHVAKAAMKKDFAFNLVAAGLMTDELANGIPSNDPFSHYNSYHDGFQSYSQSQSSNSKSSQSKPCNTGSSGSGPDPPEEPNKKNEHEKEEGESNLDAFLKLFNASSLDDIVICGIRLFKNLMKGQVKSLKKLIKQLRNNGVLTRVVETVKQLFDELGVSDVNFQNFLSLAQFVAAYISEQAAQQCEAQKGEGRTGGSYEQRREVNVDAASQEALRPGRNNLLTVFKHLYKEISRYCCEPNFRNVFSAVYHYFKHKLLPQTNQQLTVSNYFSIIKYLLEKAKALNEYTQLLDNSHPRRELVYDRVYMVFDRLVRIRIVIKIQDGNLELSSCYGVDDNTEYDYNGEEFIDPDKKRS